jgi:DNA-directed RNA polymerase subunit RPC12/RpoP
MYYYKCEHCGNANEIKTQYVVFCQKCGKKLGVNFREWLSKHPEKMLEDFYKEVCVSQSQLVEARTVQPKKREKKVNWWLYVAIFLMVAAVGYSSFFLIKKYVSGKKASVFGSEINWITEKYGEDGLTVETPFALQPSQLPFADEVRSMMDYNAYYIGSQTNGFSIVVNCIRYNSLVDTLDLPTIASGSITQMKAEPGVDDLQYNDEILTLNGIQGIMQHGVYTKNKVQFEFINLIYVSGKKLYQVMTEHKANDAKSRLVAERVIGSVNIEENK